MFKYFKDTHIDSPALKSELCSIYISKRENAEAYEGLVDVFEAEGGYNYSLYLGCQVVDAQSGDPYPYYMHRVYKSDRASMVEGSDPHIWFGDPNDAYGDMIFVSVYEEFNINLHAAYADMPINTLEDGSNLPEGAEWRLTSVVVCAYDSSFEAQFKNEGVVYTNRKSTYEIGASPYLFSADGEESFGEWHKVAPSAHFVPCDISYQGDGTYENTAESSKFAVDFVQNTTGDKFGFVPVTLDRAPFILNKDGVETASDIKLGVDMQFDFGMPDNTDDILNKVISFNYTGLADSGSFSIDIDPEGDPDKYYDSRKGTLYLMVEEDPYTHEYENSYYDIPLSVSNRQLTIDYVVMTWDDNYTFIGDVNQGVEGHIHVPSNSWNADNGTFTIAAMRPGVAYASIFFRGAEDNTREYLATLRVNVLSRCKQKSRFILSYVADDNYKADYKDFECNISKTQYDSLLKDFSLVRPYAVTIEANGSYNYAFDENEIGLIDPDVLTDSNIEDENGTPINNYYWFKHYNAFPFKNGLMVYDWTWVKAHEMTKPDTINGVENGGYIWVVEEPIADTVEYKMKAKLYQPPVSIPVEDTELHIDIYPSYGKSLAVDPSSFTIEKYGEYTDTGYDGTNTIFKCTINDYIGDLEAGVTDVNISLSTGTMYDQIISLVSYPEFQDVELSDQEYGVLNPFNVIEEDGHKKIIFFIVTHTNSTQQQLKFIDAPTWYFPYGDGGVMFPAVGPWVNEGNVAWAIKCSKDDVTEELDSYSSLPIAQQMFYNA